MSSESIHSEFWNDLHVVALHDSGLIAYPEASQAPFDPESAYPEYRGEVSERPNPVYAAVRRAVALLRRDAENDGTSAWNPLRGIVEPGMKVVIKPNLVADCVRPGADLIALFTHMSVIRPLIDFVRVALRGDGQITLGDAPIQRTDWENLLRVSAMGEAFARLNDRESIPVRLMDFRREVTRRDRFDMVVAREVRDAIDFVEVDLGAGSTLIPIIDSYRKFRVSQYDPAALQRNHNPRRNSYMIHRSILDADVVINIPKLKSHKKAGITCALKNLVGINCGKDWLPHYRVGDAETGEGDQYGPRSRLRAIYSVLLDKMESGGWSKRRLASILAKGLSGTIRLKGGDSSVEGNWHGNDTTWRMVHDLNLILCYASSTGVMRPQPQRRALHVVDGIIGGEGDTPLQPTAHPAGVVLAGTNPVAVDLAAALLMGFDPAKVPLLRDAWRVPAAWSLPPLDARTADVVVELDQQGRARRLGLAELGEHINLRFTAPPGWLGKIERARPTRLHPTTPSAAITLPASP